MRASVMQRLFAFALAHGAKRHERQVEERKRALLGGLRGTVVEIGPGAGVNLRYLGPGVRWIGIEPNVAMHGYLRAQAREHGIDAALVRASAEALPLRDACADAVVGTLVLCSVGSPSRVLGEVRRVLRPGGRFVFLEHVAAPGGSRLLAWQRRLAPLTRRVLDGCDPSRDTLATLRGAGFTTVDAQRFEVDVPLVRPHVAGAAER